MSAIKEHYHDEIEKGQRVAMMQNPEPADEPEMLSDSDIDNSDEIIDYECLGCGHIQDHPGNCDRCTGSAVDPVYF